MGDISCKHCKEYSEVRTEYGIVRRCNRYKILLEEKCAEKVRPDLCRKGVDDGKAD